MISPQIRTEGRPCEDLGVAVTDEPQRGLRRNQPCQHLISDSQPPGLLWKLPSLQYFVSAAPQTDSHLRCVIAQGSAGGLGSLLNLAELSCVRGWLSASPQWPPPGGAATRLCSTWSLLLQEGAPACHGDGRAERREMEGACHHFCCIPLAKADHMASLTSARGGETHLLRCGRVERQRT